MNVLSLARQVQSCLTESYRLAQTGMSNTKRLWRKGKKNVCLCLTFHPTHRQLRTDLNKQSGDGLYEVNNVDSKILYYLWYSAMIELSVALSPAMRVPTFGFSCWSHLIRARHTWYWNDWIHSTCRMCPVHEYTIHYVSWRLSEHPQPLPVLNPVITQPSTQVARLASAEFLHLIYLSYVLWSRYGQNMLD